jgi:hypothetical protein
MAVKHLVGAFEDEDYFDTAVQRALYLEMVYWADRSGVIRLSQAETAARVRVSPRLVSKEIGRLKDLGRLKQLGHGRWAIQFNRSKDEDGGIDQCYQCGRPVAADEAVVIKMADGDYRYHRRCREQLKRDVEKEAQEAPDGDRS